MTNKPYQNNSKASSQRPVRKDVKGAADTTRMFVNINEIVRRTQALPLTRYVE